MSNLFLIITLAIALHISLVFAKQVALRPLPTRLLHPRSISYFSDLFRPTNSVNFAFVGNPVDTRALFTTELTLPNNQQYVNFEKFEDLLREHDAPLCSPLSDGNLTRLTFSFHRQNYEQAKGQWSEKQGLVFIGEDESCHKGDEDRSAHKAVSIDFDDEDKVITVKARQLGAEDEEHGELTGFRKEAFKDHRGIHSLSRRTRRRRNVLFPRETKKGQPGTDVGSEDLADDFADKLRELVEEGVEGCKKVIHKVIDHITMEVAEGWEHLPEGDIKELAEDLAEEGIWVYRCFHGGHKHCKERLEESILEHVDDALTQEPEVISIHPHDWGHRANLWDPTKRNTNITAAPTDTTITCIDCKFEGALQWSFDIGFRKDGGEHLKDRIEKAALTFKVTETIKVALQLEFDVPNTNVQYSCDLDLIPEPPPAFPVLDCSLAVGVENEVFKPSGATHDEKKREKAMSKGNSGKQVNGFDLWPMTNAMFDSNASRLNSFRTLPGFEMELPAGQELTVDLAAKNVVNNQFDPIVNTRKANMQLQEVGITYSESIGPKAGLNIGLPNQKVGLGIGARWDIVKKDYFLGVQEKVTSSCGTTAEDGERIFDKAFGMSFDIKTGVFAYLNIAGFSVDTSWLKPDIPGAMGGLYVGKVLLSHCWDCGDSCVPDFVHTKIQELKEKFLQFLDRAFGAEEAGVKKSELSDSLVPERMKSGSYSRTGDLPSGQPGVICRPEKNSRRRRGVLGSRGHLGNTTISLGDDAQPAPLLNVDGDDDDDDEDSGVKKNTCMDDDDDGDDD